MISNKPQEEILVISRTELLISSLRVSLKSITGIEVKGCCVEADFQRHKVNLKEKKRIPIVLAGLDTDELDYWFWSVLRAEKELLNPIIVFGRRPVQEVLLSNSVFAEGAGKYHRYLGPPWLLFTLLEVVQTIKPLYDDNVRDYFFRKFGQPDLYGRMMRMLHDFKGIVLDKDVLALRNTLRLASLLDDVELMKILHTCLDELAANRQCQARLLKPKLLDLICDRNSD